MGLPAFGCRLLARARAALVDGFDELSKGITETDASYEKQRRDIDDPRFAVLKERSHIYNRLQKMANDAEERLILLLGQFGILHLCRSPDALDAVNTALAKKKKEGKEKELLDLLVSQYGNEPDYTRTIVPSDDIDTLHLNGWTAVEHQSVSS